MGKNTDLLLVLLRSQRRATSVRFFHAHLLGDDTRCADTDGMDTVCRDRMKVLWQEYIKALAAGRAIDGVLDGIFSQHDPAAVHLALPYETIATFLSTAIVGLERCEPGLKSLRSAAICAHSALDQAARACKVDKMLGKFARAKKRAREGFRRTTRPDRERERARGDKGNR